jgi:hypothetical protein
MEVAPAPVECAQRERDSGLVGDGGKFAPGTAVMVAGVQSQPELNGQWGVVRAARRGDDIHPHASFSAFCYSRCRCEVVDRYVD